MASGLRGLKGGFGIAGILCSGALLACAQPGFAQACSMTTGTVSVPSRHHTLSVAELQVPGKAWDHFYKAAAATDQKVFDREADKALEIAPDFVDVYVLRAARQLQNGDSDAAIATVGQARHLRPEVPWSSILVAAALTRQRRFDEAIAELDRARGVESGSWQWKFERARAEIGRHSAEGSLRWSALAMAAVPGDCSEAHLLRLDAFLIAGQRKQAIAEMENYLKMEGRPAAREQVMRLLAETRAASQEEEARTSRPDGTLVAGVEEPAKP